MNSQTIFVEVLSSVNILPSNPINPVFVDATPVFVKGVTNFTYNLTGVSNEPFRIVKVNFIYNDPRQGELVNYNTDLTSLTSNILTQYSYVYYTGNTYYYTITTYIDFYLDTGGMIRFRQPITIAQTSMYDDIDDLTIANSQILDIDPTQNLINFSSDKNNYTIIGVLSS